MDGVRHNHDASGTNKDPSPKPKRPYLKPAFQHEKVFETMALTCGKLGPTQAQCRFNRRTS